MTDLEKYDAVNRCETIEELTAVIRSFADEHGIIEGRLKNFRADRMAEGAQDFYDDRLYGSARTVTRQFGLRQQLIYLKFYK